MRLFSFFWCGIYDQATVGGNGSVVEDWRENRMHLNGTTLMM
jgi:hypothetical protein